MPASNTVSLVVQYVVSPCPFYVRLTSVVIISAVAVKLHTSPRYTAGTLLKALNTPIRKKIRFKVRQCRAWVQYLLSAVVISIQ